MTSWRQFLLTAVMLSSCGIALLLPSGETIGLVGRAHGQNVAIVAQLIFSGQPDPQWTIADPARQQLPSFLAGVPPVSPPNWPQFGCRGLQVLNPDPLLAFPPLVRVFEGIIEIGNSYFADVHGLEAFLGSTMPTSIDSNRNGISDVCEP